MDTIDGSETLHALRRDLPVLFEGISNVNPIISARDGMLNLENLRQYFRCGAEAAQLCRKTLNEIGRSQESVETVIDYACGYGRVLRFLRAAFPSADIVGADVDTRALRHVEDLLGEKTQKLYAANGAPAEQTDSIDLIWVGSLFTHLPEEQVTEILKHLRGRLKSNGVIIFTMHGEFVAERIRKREKIYNLSDEACSELTDLYAEKSYGFVPYRGQASYGISICRMEKMSKILEKVDFDLRLYIEKGWVGHQDTYAASLKCS